MKIKKILCESKVIRVYMIEERTWDRILMRCVKFFGFEESRIIGRRRHVPFSSNWPLAF